MKSQRQNVFKIQAFGWIDVGYKAMLITMNGPFNQREEIALLVRLCQGERVKVLGSSTTVNEIQKDCSEHLG